MMILKPSYAVGVPRRCACSRSFGSWGTAIFTGEAKVLAAAW